MNQHTVQPMIQVVADPIITELIAMLERRGYTIIAPPFADGIAEADEPLIRWTQQANSVLVSHDNRFSINFHGDSWEAFDHLDGSNRSYLTCAFAQEWCEHRAAQPLREAAMAAVETPIPELCDRCAGSGFQTPDLPCKSCSGTGKYIPF